MTLDQQLALDGYACAGPVWCGAELGTHMYCPDCYRRVA